MNMVKNCALVHWGFIVSPENSGNQWVKAAKIANTAPILST